MQIHSRLQMQSPWACRSIAVATCKVALEHLRPPAARAGRAPHIVMPSALLYGRENQDTTPLWPGDAFLEIQLFKGRRSESGHGWSPLSLDNPSLRHLQEESFQDRKCCHTSLGAYEILRLNSKARVQKKEGAVSVFNMTG